MTQKVLITGITGQVGSQLADYLLANTDWEVAGMMRWLEPMNNLNHLTDRINQNDRISLFYADLGDYASIVFTRDGFGVGWRHALGQLSDHSLRPLC